MIGTQFKKKNVYEDKIVEDPSNHFFFYFDIMLTCLKVMMIVKTIGPNFEIV